MSSPWLTQRSGNSGVYFRNDSFCSSILVSAYNSTGFAPIPFIFSNSALTALFVIFGAVLLVITQFRGPSFREERRCCRLSLLPVYRTLILLLTMLEVFALSLFIAVQLTGAEFSRGQSPICSHECFSVIQGLQTACETAIVTVPVLFLVQSSAGAKAFRRSIILSIPLVSLVFVGEVAIANILFTSIRKPSPSPLPFHFSSASSASPLRPLSLQPIHNSVAVDVSAIDGDTNIEGGGSGLHLLQVAFPSGYDSALALHSIFLLAFYSVIIVKVLLLRARQHRLEKEAIAAESAAELGEEPNSEDAQINSDGKSPTSPRKEVSVSKTVSAKEGRYRQQSDGEALNQHKDRQGGEKKTKRFFEGTSTRSTGLSSARIASRVLRFRRLSARYEDVIKALEEMENEEEEAAGRQNLTAENRSSSQLIASGGCGRGDEAFHVSAERIPITIAIKRQITRGESQKQTETTEKVSESPSEKYPAGKKASEDDSLGEEEAFEGEKEMKEAKEAYLRYTRAKTLWPLLFFGMVFHCITLIVFGYIIGLTAMVVLSNRNSSADAFSLSRPVLPPSFTLFLSPAEATSSSGDPSSLSAESHIFVFPEWAACGSIVQYLLSWTFPFLLVLVTVRDSILWSSITVKSFSSPVASTPNTALKKTTPMPGHPQPVDNGAEVGADGSREGDSDREEATFSPFNELEQQTLQWESLGYSRAAIERTVTDVLSHLLPSRTTLMTKIFSYEQVKLKKRLGEGGRGAIYLATLRMEKAGPLASVRRGKTITVKGGVKELTVAVKLAKFEELSSSTIETIIEEANCLSVLRHERIVRFYGLFIRPPHVGLVMEYCPKGSLDRFIRPPSREHKSENNAEVKARLPQVTTTSSTQLTSVMLTDGSSGNKIQQENYRDASSTRESRKQGDVFSSLREKLRIAMECAEAVLFLHCVARLVHRDLKSANFVLDNNGHVKMIDLGEAQRIARGARLGTGTLRWMAPEVFVRRPRETGLSAMLRSCFRRNEVYVFRKGELRLKSRQAMPADIYSLGMVLYEIFEGRIPYDNVRWDSQVEDLIRSGRHPSVTEAFWPSPVLSLVRRCWSLRPQDRPNITEVVAALRSSLASLEVAAVSVPDNS